MGENSVTELCGGSMRVYRVTVRGRFRDLTDSARQYLVRALPDHDIFNSAFTPEGTFTYDERLAAFNLRYELRVDPADGFDAGDPADRAALLAELEAETFLSTMGFDHHPLRTEVVDLSAVMGSLRRTVRPPGPNLP